MGTEILTETPVFLMLNSLVVEAGCVWRVGMVLSRIKLESAFELVHLQNKFLKKL